MLLEATTSLLELQQLVYSMDMHGAFVVVSESKNPRHVGISGIIAKDSVSAFHIIDESNRCIVLPKKTTTVQFEIQSGKKATLLPS